MTLVMLNGVLSSTADAVVPVTDRGFTHGLGLYETLKLVDGVPVFFDEHADRLERGVAELGLEPCVGRDDLAAQICRLAAANGAPNACRVLLTAGPPDGPPTLFIEADLRRFPAPPLSVVTFEGVRVSAQLKAMTVMQSYLAQRAAQQADVHDAILVDEQGRIFEGATSNMFLVRGGGLVTPPAEGAILPGVLRGKIEDLAIASGVPVVEAYARVAELRPDDGMLLTSSVRGIVSVGRVDDRPLRVDGGLVERLCSLLGDAETASMAAFRRRYPTAAPATQSAAPPALDA
jgi:branched-subunit amino acid aminotransferase/4-amino-4-deoxychorismate lyase